MRAMHTFKSTDMVFRTQPQFVQIFDCLLSLKDAGIGANIKEVAKHTGLDRNLVSRTLNTFEAIGLVKAKTVGRSETFSLTRTAQIYTFIILEKYSSCAKVIDDLLNPIERKPETLDFIASTEAIAVGEVIGEIPSEVKREMIIEGEPMEIPGWGKALSTEVTSRILRELEALFLAFTIAKNSLEAGTPEQKVAEDVTRLLGHVYFPSLHRSVAKSELPITLLKKAKEILESVAKAKQIAKELHLEEIPIEVEEIGKNGKGRPIYRVK